MVISEILAHCYDMWTTIITAINFCNEKEQWCSPEAIIME